MRDISGISAYINEKHGTEPIITITVYWAEDEVGYYADKEFGKYEGKILELSGLNTTVKIGTIGNTGNINIKLDDNDGSLKTIYDSHDIHKRRCVIAQNFSTSSIILFDGQINTPIVWTENPRTLSFEVVALTEDREIGYSPEEGDYDYIDPEIIGKAWPLCFGSNVKYEALKITEAPALTCLTKYNLLTVADTQDMLSVCDDFEIALRKLHLADFEIDLYNQSGGSTPKPDDQNYLTVLGSALTAQSQWLNLIEELIAKCPDRYAAILNFAANCEYQKYIEVVYDEFLQLRDTLILNIRQLQIDTANNRELNSTLRVEINSTQAIIDDPTATDDEHSGAISRINSLRSQLNENESQYSLLRRRYRIAYRTLNGHHMPDEFNGELAKAPDVVQYYATTIPNIWNAWVTSDNPEGLDEVPGLNDIMKYTQELLILIRFNTQQLTNQMVQCTLTTITVDTSKYTPPQSTSMVIRVNEAKFRGTFLNNVFTITQSFIPTDTNIQLANRPIDDLNPNHFYITDSSYNLKNKFVLMHIVTDAYQADKILYVTDQVAVFAEDQITITGTKCIFNTLLWVPEFTGKSSVHNPDERSYIKETCPILPARWMGGVGISGSTLTPDVDWGINYSDLIYVAEDYTDIYVVSLNPVEEIVEVYSKRNIEGREQLLPVPSMYYTKYLTYEIGGKTISAIEFKRPLSQYKDENWSDTIYVSSKESTVGNNTTDIIKYLIETYTNLTIDAVSFAEVKSYLTNYPSHFVLTERGNCLKIVEEIAWQARCGIIIRNGIVYIKYLAKEDDSCFSINEGNVAKDSLSIEYTSTEDIVTKLIAEWQANGIQDKPHQMILRNNIPKYGLQEETYNFYIYNIESLVRKSLTFWTIRYSNTWKIIKVTCFLESLLLEPYDTVLLNFDTAFVASDDVKGLVTEAVYDSSEFSCKYTIWVPVRAGESTKYPLAWPKDSSVKYPTETDIYAGGES